MIIRPSIPRVFVPLLAPSRFKGAWGGRGSGKSHFFAEMLVLRAASGKTRAVCIREVQNTIKESVRQIIIDKIAKFQLTGFEVLDAEIRCPHGGLIIFKGMQSYNAESIKSLEGYDVAWVEEAQSLSATSLRMLRPTIRAPGSEIWFSWNPRHDTDPVDVFLREKCPPGAVVVRANWSDNPWFPNELKAEMAIDKANDPEMAYHVWEGGYEIITEGAYYALLLAKADLEDRIGEFAYDPALPVLTAWDIGVDDYTAIWFMQENGAQVRAIDYFEASGEGAEEIVRMALPELIPDLKERAEGVASIGRQYHYGKHFFPHDVRVREWGAGAKTRQQTLMGLGLKPINVGVAANPADRINAGRRLLPAMHFDKTRCALGIKRLRGYSRRFNNAMGTFTGPLHDENSHGADAFGEFAMNCRIAQKPEAGKPKPRDIWSTSRDDATDWKAA